MRALLLGFVPLVVACTSYDPKLGPKPFQCGTNGACPDGYVCQADTTGAMACTLAGPGAGNPDAPGVDAPEFVCADDSNLEGATRNDTVATASVTPVASTRKTLSLAGLSICPDGDKDTYRVDITANNQSLAVSITYDAPTAEGGVGLSLSILNANGTPVANGAGTGNNMVAVTAPNLMTTNSPYFVQVYGPVTGKNNYKLKIDVTP